MIRSQPSVMSATVKSIAEDEDESIPCFPDRGLVNPRSRKQSVDQADVMDGVVWRESERREMLYDTATVTTSAGLGHGLEMLFMVLVHNS
ncbi:hypothetical protein VZT92_006986 [Zoarces viviparus]|uniref:Uncharacterized protein n=1 Tax=Zoarces viviparus TaxID=48416 RepID=A0AAW1FIE0_ZOAVI